MSRRTRTRGRAAQTPLVARLARAAGITTARRAGVLALAICALVLSLAGPLHSYLQMQARLETLHHQQAELEQRIAELEHRRSLLKSPAYIEVQARKRLGYAYPGRTPYIVQLPGTPFGAHPEPADTESVEPWYVRLWSSLAQGGR